jgi:hypothetical protein
MIACLTFACALWTPLRAGLITNGGFEAGLAGWTVANQVGSDGTFFVQSGTMSPLGTSAVPAPPQGTQAAMTDAQGPGSHVLYQDFVIPSLVPGAFINFSLLINNLADRFETPNHLDFATPDLNQRARVDIVTTSADPFSLNTADVLLNVYETQVGDPLVSGYTNFLVDVTTLLQGRQGETLRLRFAGVDNVGPFNFGVDAVDINVTSNPIPEPSTFGLLAGGCIALTYAKRRWRLMV